LLAVAKLGAPLKKRQDVDVTINVKFDLDWLWHIGQNITIDTKVSYH
jgi:hypothetical protein